MTTAKDEPRRGRLALFVIGIAAIVAAVGFALLLHARRTHADRAERAARVKELEKGPRVPVVQATVAPLTRKVTLPGDVRPFRQATVYARVSGYLVTLNVDRGDRVAKNQVLGRVTTPETDRQLRPLVESYVAKKAVADRLRPLVPKGVVAEIDLERADADATAAKSEVDRIGALQGFDVLRAPFAGIVTQRYVDVGALMPAPTNATQSAQPLVDIADTTRVRVVIYLGQRDAVGVRLGDALSVLRDDDPLHPIAGRVTQIPHELDPRTRTMWVECDLDNPTGKFYPGVYVTVVLDVAAPPGVLIPSAALALRGGSPSVALIEGGVAHFAAVEVADDDGTQARVIKGIAPGATLATRVGDEIVDGGRVQPVAPKPPARQGAGPQPKASS